MKCLIRALNKDRRSSHKAGVHGTLLFIEKSF